jgi:VanZ family protein
LNAILERMWGALRIAAWLSLLALVIASWTPGYYMVRTGVGGSFEHVGAYFVATLLWVLAYSRLPPWGIGAALAAYAGILELGQLYVPGRHSQFEDFAASCAGIALVILAAILFQSGRAVSIGGSPPR